MIFDVDDNLQLSAEFWAELVRLRANYVCEDCGAAQGDRRHDAHHVDENHENNCLSNGECLCVGCHARKSMKAQWERRGGKMPVVKCECGREIAVTNIAAHKRVCLEAVA